MGGPETSNMNISLCCALNLATKLVIFAVFLA
jgi:hypothetical protein